MKIEHFALNVADPTAVAAWYTQHLGFKVVRSNKAAHDVYFLADDSGAVMLEIYANPPGQELPFAKMDPLLLHLAFVSKDPEADKTALLAAGATLVADQRLDDGTHLVMLRDPWGLAIQLCKRAKPMLNVD